MAIDYRQTREKASELDKSRLTIMSMLATVESGDLFGEFLTLTQVGNLEDKLKLEAANLKTIAGEIKTLIG